MVVDASVAVKWFSREHGGVRARSFLRRHIAGTVHLIAPDLLIYEVGNALVRGKQLSARSVRDALAILQQSGVEMVPLTEAMIARAAEWCEAKRLTFYDAAYLAVAAEFSIPLLSANPKDQGVVEGIEVKKLI